MIHRSIPPDILETVFQEEETRSHIDTKSVDTSQSNDKSALNTEVDFFTAFLPFFTVTSEALDFHWPFGNIMCKLNSTETYLNMFASVYILVVISVDRCVSVVWPVWAQNHRNVHMASCEEPHPVEPVKSALKIIAAVITTFFLCWAPYHIMSLIEMVHFTGGDSETLQHVIDICRPIATSLAFLNSCLNPLLYVFMGQDFKDKVHKSILNILETVFQEEETRSHTYTNSMVTSRSKEKSFSDEV
ncbi:chemokine-like receptor 1 [Lates japonicus]|uniref:Chemokine-like receptor 1 n=1 Tax=Lates japonicus TaxID=270547 RepID=A0AAD3NFE9_LATJO|nr:chemokine-like receptor 1 [Lates japonicus]